MDIWIVISGLVGVVLPPVIEMFSKKVEGRNKVIAVLITCMVLSVVQAGVEENFVGSGWDVETIILNFVIVFTVAVNMWNSVWKQWFPNDPSPIKTNWNH